MADAQLFNTKLQEWEDFYNFDRPHGGLGGQTPYERLRAKTRTPAVRGDRQLHMEHHTFACSNFEDMHERLRHLALPR